LIQAKTRSKFFLLFRISHIARLPGRSLPQLVWGAWLVWLPAAWLAPAQAQTDQPRHAAISARAWLSDPTGQPGPDQVRQMAWTPDTGRL
jgi:hypothetical protein